MNFDEYQELAARTARTDIRGWTRPLNYALGLCGEAGEVAEHIKKWAFHDGKPVDVDALKKELGDVLWYLAMQADEWGLALSEVANANIEKLQRRYPHGFGKRADEEDGA